MPSGYPFSRSVRRELFDRVCWGSSIRDATGQVGVSYNTGWIRRRDAGAMKLLTGKGDLGLADPGDLDRPGGRGHRISFTERVAVMRGLDRGRSQAEIARQLDRSPSDISREIARNCNPDGDYHAGLAHARATEKAKRPKGFKLDDQRLCVKIAAGMDVGGVRS